MKNTALLASKQDKQLRVLNYETIMFDDIEPVYFDPWFIYFSLQMQE